jgi:aspartyl-tRNA(Asn)/glutamyl-tRNA(Gln) amidotransferase subunit B
MSNDWEIVVGLEVHCELKTASKLFCGCANEFGAEPNTHICPVCLGLPGSLPVINRMAVELAMRIGVALHCEVKPSIFHRKNYFYPDMPKDYQVSQYDEPINVEGWLELPDGFRVGIERAHMEEDTGKTTHIGATGRIHGADYSLVDYNRSGVPLVEIVSKPDLRGAEQARAYVSELRGVLVATGASDGKMEEGSLRVDANVSLRPAGTETLGTRCEIKNLNSLRSLGRAIEYEATRQAALLDKGEAIVQETRHWDEAKGKTQAGRSKEEAYDYRYFPEPDLVPLAPDEAWKAAVVAGLPALPAERRVKLAAAAGVAPADVAVVVEQDLDHLVNAAIDVGGDARIALKRAANEVAGRHIATDAFVTLVKMETDGRLTTAQARAVLSDVLESGGDPTEIAAAKGFEAMDAGDLASVIDDVIAANPDEAERYKGGEQKLMGFFVSKVKEATAGNADLKAASALLREKLG